MIYIGKANVLLSIVTNRLMKQTGEYLRGGTFRYINVNFQIQLALGLFKIANN